MIMFSEMLSIVEKYWRNYENYTQELKEACLAFGNFFRRLRQFSAFHLRKTVIVDQKDTGIMVFDELKNVLMKYGEQLDDDEIELFESSVNVSDGKIIVDGKAAI